MYKERKDKFEDIYTYLYLNGRKGFVADDDIIKSHVAFQYEIDYKGSYYPGTYRYRKK